MVSKTRRPARILEKVNIRPRGRLGEIIIHNLIKLSQHIERRAARPCEAAPGIGEPSEDNFEDGPMALDAEEEEADTDNFDHLISVLTLEPIPSFTYALQIMYSGYFVNKNKCTEGNQYFTLLAKITSVEDELRNFDTSRISKSVETEDLNVHEYNITALKVVTDNYLYYLKRKYGQNVKQMVISRLARETVLSLGTLKASCAADIYPTQASMDTNENKKHAKKSR